MRLVLTDNDHINKAGFPQIADDQCIVIKTVSPTMVLYGCETWSLTLRE
jgi:hypothetical protein